MVEVHLTLEVVEEEEHQEQEEAEVVDPLQHQVVGEEVVQGLTVTDL